MTGSVLVVLHEPVIGGASKAVLQAVPRLAEAGWRFRFWAPQPGPLAELLRDQGHAVEGEPRPLRYSWSALGEPPGRRARLAAAPGYLQRFRRHVLGTAPDLVHANTIVTLPEALTARAVGAVTLLHVHEMLSGDRRGPVASRLLRLLDGVVAVSQASAVELHRVGVEADVVTAGIEPRAAGRRATRQRLVVGTLATVSHRKGSDVFVTAATAVSKRRPDVEFRMVGPLAPGAEEGWAHKVVSRAQRAGIRWEGPADAATALADWDVFVLPTRRDPFPLAVLEAMAVGLPVIATAVDGVREQVDSHSGVLVPPDDPAALAKALEDLLDDPERRASMSRAGLARVRAHFTPEHHAQQLAAAYRGALDSGGRRRGVRC